MTRRLLALIGIALGILALVVLVVLPLVLAPLASQRLSEALGVPVRVGHVELSPIGPRIGLHDVTVQLSEGTAAVVRLGRLHADLGLERLLRGTIGFDRLTLDRPRINVQRTADGDLNLAALLPPADEPDAVPEPAETATGADPVVIEIDALRIRNGAVAFIDETATPPIESFARIDGATADDLFLTVGGDAAVAVHMVSRIDDNAFDLELRYDATEDDSTLTARVRTRAAALARVLVHARLDWEHVAGTTDADVTYERTVRDGELATHRLTVDATATDLAFADRSNDEATFRAATASLDDLVVDFAAQEVALGTILADDVWALAYQSDAGLHLPFVHPEPAEETVPESSWRTTLGAVTLGEGTLLVRDVPRGAPDLPVVIRSGRITEEDGAVRFVFDTAVGEATIEIDGRARAEATTLQLALGALEVPKVASHFGSPVAFATGTVGGTVDVVFGEGPARLHGRLVASDVKSAPSAEHPEEVFAWATLELELADTTLFPLRIHATSATMRWPYLMLHRRADALYPFTGVTGESVPSSTPTAPTSEDSPMLVVDRFTIADGRVEFYDTVLETAYGTELLGLGGMIENLRVDPLHADRFDLEGSIDELSPVTVQGTLGPSTLDAEIEIDRLRLPPLSPYIEPGIRYDVTAGTASIDAAVERRTTRIEVDNDLDLARLKLKSTGRDPLKGQLGVALPVALSLMKDSRGRIALDLPLKIDLDTQEYSLGPSLVAAFRQALLGTLQSPVKILGAVLLGDGDDVFELKPVPFAPGSATLEGEGSERVAQLAKLLGRHPGLDLVLLPQTSPADAEALAGASRTASGSPDVRTLAVARGDEIRRVLHESYDLAPERVRARKPRIGRSVDATPSVDVQLRSR